MSYPLKGLKTFGPLDYSFENNKASLQAIKLGIISPETGFARILKHLNGLNEEIKATTEKDYLIEYLPFSTIYKRYLDIPQNIDNKFVKLIKEADVSKLSQLEFYDFLKRKIDYFYTIRGEFNVLILYLPNAYQKSRELKNDTTYLAQGPMPTQTAMKTQPVQKPTLYI